MILRGKGRGGGLMGKGLMGKGPMGNEAEGPPGRSLLSRTERVGRSAVGRLGGGPTDYHCSQVNPNGRSQNFELPARGL